MIPILDENIHSPASVLARCPFLFTVSAYLPSHLACPSVRSKVPMLMAENIYPPFPYACPVLMQSALWRRGTTRRSRTFTPWRSTSRRRQPRTRSSTAGRRWRLARHSRCGACTTRQLDGWKKPVHGAIPGLPSGASIPFREARCVRVLGLTCFYLLCFLLCLCRNMVGAGTGRLATELHLSRIQESFADERQERESHNRTRMWLLCFVMDRCLSIHLGRAWMVQEDAVRTCHALSLRILLPWATL